METGVTLFLEEKFQRGVQSLLPKIDELIALIQVENFDVIALNETWLDTQNKHLLAEVSILGYKVFHLDKPTPSGRGGGSIMNVKNTLNPIERKSSATCTRGIIQVDINPKNAVHLKLVLIYRNTRITAVDDHEFYRIRGVVADPKAAKSLFPEIKLVSH